MKPKTYEYILRRGTGKKSMSAIQRGTSWNKYNNYRDRCNTFGPASDCKSLSSEEQQKLKEKYSSSEEAGALRDSICK